MFENFNISDITAKFPSVIKPAFKLPLREKVKWTLIILVAFFILGSVPTWGVQQDAITRFEFLEIVFGSKFGSLITLGIGPIVTASIILQLLVGSKILNWNIQSPEGKAKFMGVQKILTVAFCFIESAAYVMAGAIPASTSALVPIVILQLAIGGIIIIFMDEVCSKWGIGSGVSLFIAAGVSKTIILRMFNPLTTEGLLPTAESAASGIIPSFFTTLGAGQPMQAFLTLFPLIATAVVFIIVVFAQGIRIEVPIAFSLPFGKFGARRWSLKYFYTSNIPVILTAAVIANLQMIAKLMSSKGITWLGTFDQQGQASTGLIYFFTHPSSASLMLMVVLGGVFTLLFAMLAVSVFKKYVIRMSALGAITGLILGYVVVSAFGLPAIMPVDMVRTLTYTIIMIAGSIIFSLFWVNTSGMDAHSVAEQFKSANIMIPGFRHDPRVVDRILGKYITPLAILGGASVGFLAGFADLTSALGTGTGILLTVMIVYQLYEQLVQQHYDELPEFVKKLVGT